MLTAGSLVRSKDNRDGAIEVNVGATPWGSKVRVCYTGLALVIGQDKPSHLLQPSYFLWLCTPKTIWGRSHRFARSNCIDFEVVQ